MMKKIKQNAMVVSSFITLLGSVFVPAFYVSQALAQQVEELPLLSEELDQLSKDLDREIVYDAELIKGIQLAPGEGVFEVDQYLTTIVENAGLKVAYQGNKILVLTPEQFAQQVKAGSVKAEVSEDFFSDGIELEELVVSGSLIRRSGVTAIDSLRVIDRDTIKARGEINISDALIKSSAAAGPQVNAQSANQGAVSGSAGRREIDLRGLGANRTLVLINGRAVPPGGLGTSSTVTDLATLPSAVVDRVEVLSQGSSSVYGSESLAGTVNYVTDDKLDGFRLDLSGIIPFEGGGERGSTSIAWGKNFEESSVLVAYEYNKMNALKWGDRREFRCEVRAEIDPSTGRRTDIDPATGLPRCTDQQYGFATLTIADPFNGFSQQAFVPAMNNQFNGVNGFREVQQNFDEAGLPIAQGVTNDVSDTRPNVDLIGKGERHNFFLSADKNTDLFGGTRLYTELAYAQNSDSSVQQARVYEFTLSPNSLINPFSIEAELENPGIPVGEVSVNARPRLVDPTTSTDIKSGRLVLGAEGILPFDSWRWSLDYQYGRSQAELGSQVISRSRVAQALEVQRSADGQLSCIDPSNGCVVINPFDRGFLLGRAGANRELQRFLLADSIETTTTERNEITFIADGKLFQTPYGPISSVVGLNYREDKVDHDRSPVLQRNDVFSSLSAIETIDKSKFDTAGLFAEIEIPLVSGKPWAEEVVVNLSGRYTKDDQFSNFSYKASGRYALSDFVSLRASYSTSFRSPNLFERFRKTDASDDDFALSSFIDPCDAYGFSFSQDSVRFRNCQALGLPLDFVARAPQSVLQGANPSLKPEEGNSVVFGVDFSIPRLDAYLGLTYFDIEIENAIQRQLPASLLNTCYDSPGLRSPLCGQQFIGPRDANGHLTTIDARDRNSAFDAAEGLDIEFEQYGELGGINYGVQAEVTYLKSRKSQTVAGAREYDVAGSIGFPEWKGDITFSTNYKDLGFNWNVNYVGKVDQANVDPLVFSTPAGRRLIHSIDAFTYHNVGVSYRWSDTVALSLGVNNVFDKRPPIISDLPIIGDSSEGSTGGRSITSYEVNGRSVLFRLSTSF